MGYSFGTTNELQREECVKIARGAFGMWADRKDLGDTVTYVTRLRANWERAEGCRHVFEPLEHSVHCTFCDYEPSPEIIAVSLNALEHIKRALRKWPKTALVQLWK